jgi:hypothetical protein
MVHARNGAPMGEAFNVWPSSGRSTIQPFFADAEDLTQESFLSLFRRIGSFRHESSFTTWLYRLVVDGPNY